MLLARLLRVEAPGIRARSSFTARRENQLASLGVLVPHRDQAEHARVSLHMDQSRNEEEINLQFCTAAHVPAARLPDRAPP